MKSAFELHLGLVVGLLKDSIWFSSSFVSGLAIVFELSLTSLCILQNVYKQRADIVQSLYGVCAIIVQTL